MTENMDYDNDFDDENTSQRTGANSEDEGQSSRDRSNRSARSQSADASHPRSSQSALGGGSDPAGQSPRPGSDLILNEIRRLSSSVSQIADRVGKLEARGPTPCKKPRTAESRSWADDYNSDDCLSDDDHTPLMAPESLVLSEHNTSMVVSAFGSCLSNGERRKMHRSFPTPEVSATRCPKLDPIFRTTKVKQEVKAADAELADYRRLYMTQPHHCCSCFMRLIQTHRLHWTKETP